MKGWTRRSRLRRMHNDEDPTCRHWWGDRSGMDVNARCYVCRPRTCRNGHPLSPGVTWCLECEKPIRGEAATPEEVPWEEIQEYQMLDVRGHDWIYLAPPWRAVVSRPPAVGDMIDEFCGFCGREGHSFSGCTAMSAEAPAATEEELTPLVGVPAPPEVPEADDDPDDDPEVEAPSSLRHELAAALNRVSAESGSDTPDFILAEYLAASLEVFDTAVRQRDTWYGYRPWDRERG